MDNKLVAWMKVEWQTPAGIPTRNACTYKKGVALATTIRAKTRHCGLFMLETDNRLDRMRATLEKYQQNNDDKDMRSQGMAGSSTDHTQRDDPAEATSGEMGATTRDDNVDT